MDLSTIFLVFFHGLSLIFPCPGLSSARLALAHAAGAAQAHGEELSQALGEIRSRLHENVLHLWISFMHDFMISHGRGENPGNMDVTWMYCEFVMGKLVICGADTGTTDLQKVAVDLQLVYTPFHPIQWLQTLVSYLLVLHVTM